MSRMSILAEIQTLERKLADAPRTLYRGTKDVLPSKLNHSLVDPDGVWGAGTYLSTDKSVASWYAFKGADAYGVLTEYKPSTLNAVTLKPHEDYEPIHPTESDLKLTPQGQKKLKSKQKVVKQSEVGTLAQKAGFNAVEIDDRALSVNEPMMLLLPGTKITPVKYSISDWDDNIHEFKPSQLAEAESQLKAGLKHHDAFINGKSKKLDPWRKKPPAKKPSKGGDDWFHALPKEEQQLYLKEHPRSKKR